MTWLNFLHNGVTYCVWGGNTSQHLILCIVNLCVVKIVAYTIIIGISIFVPSVP
jgi:hypothetical protein